jgi:hypothetical protein
VQAQASSNASGHRRNDARSFPERAPVAIRHRRSTSRSRRQPAKLTKCTIPAARRADHAPGWGYVFRKVKDTWTIEERSQWLE